MSYFHYRYYRYVRMMLRRYPKMRNESFAHRGNHGTRAICERKDMDKHVEFLRTAAQIHFLRYKRPLFDGEASMRAKTVAALAARSKKR
jgi:hypothetical protein